MSRFLAVCLNPTFQRTISLAELEPGEVNRATKARLDASGKGINVARVLRQLGGEVRHLTHLGPGSDEFLSLCRTDGLEVIWTDSPSPIRTCITLLDGSHSSTTEIIEPTEPVDESTVSRVRELFGAELQSSDWLILSGSKAPGYPADLFAEFCGMAREAGVRVLADYRGKELEASLRHQPTVVKVNLVEFCATFLPDLTVSEADDRNALPKVESRIAELSRSGIRWVITRGARDVLCAEEGEVRRVNTRKIVPVNTIGSGDSVAAGMAFSLGGGNDLEQAVREGVRCGALNALQLKPGSLE